MRRFAFKLEKLLEIREYHEREWEIKLAEVSSRCLSVDQEIASWGERRRQETSIGYHEGPVDVSRLSDRDHYLTLIDDRVRNLRRNRDRLENERSEVQERYLEASRKRKVLTKLKERRSAEYYRTARREEGKEIDEIGATMADRRIGERGESDV